MTLSPDDWEVIRLSLKVALVGVFLTLPVAFALAYVLARRRFPGRILLDALVHLPLVLPPVVTGYVLLVLFGRKGPIGAFLEQTAGLVFAFRWTGAALASAVMGFPLMVRAIRLAIEAIDPRLEGAAATPGAGKAAGLATVTLPLALPGILAGMVLAFARALGEFGATIMVAGYIPGKTATLSLSIYHWVELGRDGDALRLLAISVALAFGSVLLSEYFLRRPAA